MTTSRRRRRQRVRAPHRGSTAESDRALVWRMRRLATCMLLFALAFVQAPGQIVADTKLDLTQAPVGFLGRALQMWDPAGFGGQVQNQAYGYLFPIGPFFALGDVLGLPPWVVQRLWWGVVVSRRLPRHHHPGPPARRSASPTTQLLAGVAFAVSPRMMSTLGPVSAEAWPMALAPWVVVPLVAATATGGLRRPAMASAFAVALMGGVNAALCLAAVVPAATYLAHAAALSPGCSGWLAWWIGLGRGGDTLVGGAAAPARPLQPALPRLHRDRRRDDVPDDDPGRRCAAHRTGSPTSGPTSGRGGGPGHDLVSQPMPDPRQHSGGRRRRPRALLCVGCASAAGWSSCWCSASSS